VLEDIKREYSFTLVNSWGFIKALRGEIKPKIRPYSHALTVLPNGTLIYPNDIVGEPIGNLVEEDLMELVSSEKAKKMREIAIKRMHDYEYLHLQTASFNSFLDSLSYAKEMFKWKYLANGKKLNSLSSNSTLDLKISRLPCFSTRLSVTSYKTYCPDLYCI
jgi:hypothetical protein